MVLVFLMAYKHTLLEIKNLALPCEGNIFLSQTLIDNLELVFNQSGHFLKLFAFLIDKEVNLPLIQHFLILGKVIVLC